METFLINPESSSYAVEDGPSFIGVRLDGGASRFRKDKLGTARNVEVRWVFDRNEYLYFTSFYNSTINEGSLPFLIELILDDPIPTLHQAHFLQDTKKLANQQGHAYTVSATLEALPVTIDNQLNLARVAAYEANPNTDLSQITIIPIAPPSTVGSIPNQLNNDTDVINLDLSGYFDDSGFTMTFDEANLPDGLGIDLNTGIVSGTIDQAITALFVTITATNEGGFVQQQFTWTISQ